MKNLAPSISLLVALSFVSNARADFNPIPLTADSFTQDVIVEKTATPPAQTLVTANMDAGTNITGTVGGTGGNHGTFYEIGFGTTAGSGLPYHGSIFNAVSNTTHKFQMPADYTLPNAVFVGGSGSVNPQVLEGALAVTAPSSYTTLSILTAAGSGPAYVQVTVQYSDGNFDQQIIAINDWTLTNNASVNNTAWIANGYMQGSDGSFQKVNTTPQTGRLFFYDMPLNYPTSLMTNIVFDYESGGRAAIFAVSGSTDSGATFSPIAVTGYNYDMIIEAPLAKAVTATMDAGLLIPTTSTFFAMSRGDNNAWFEQGFNLINASTTPTPRAQNGLPHPGTQFTALSNATHSFQMPPTYTGPCAVMVNSQVTTGTLTLNTPAALNAISILNSAGTGPLNVAVSVNHADGSSEISSYLCPDWFGSLTTNQNVAYIAAGRVPMGRANTINNGGTATGTLVFYNDIPLSNTGSPVTSVQFSYTSGNGRACIFGVSGATDGVNFSPLSVTGFNEDMIVEANAITNMDLRAFSTASMDGGTNNNGNIWYEQGWNPLAPDSGLPPAGSILTSTNLTDHHYQLASSYTANNAVYCDSNNPIANITFASPTNFSAVSFLSANANQGIQIKVILNHDGAPSETNVFNSKDWFSGTPSAFTTDGRCSSDTRTANNWLPGTSNPRLYEAQFALADTVHNVTGATLIWTTNNGTGGISSANSRFVVLAVSGTLGATPPVVSSVYPSPYTGYEGTNFTLTATAGGNPAPTYQWQACAIGTGAFTNISDAGVYSGTQTAALSFTNPDWTYSGDYQLVAMNAVGTTSSSTVTVKIVSGLPNVVGSTDPMSSFGGASPNGQDVTRVFDRVVGTNKYLNFGVNGTTPFAGPAGLIVTPSIGSTVLSAVRLYTPNDHEERDPADYILEGSNDGGNTWSPISSGALALPSTRSTTIAVNPLTEPLQEIHFANSTAYTSYRFTVNNVKTNDAANSMQIGEMELLGAVNATAPYFIFQPPAAVTNYVGGSPALTVLAAGPSPLTYQWRRDNNNILGATNPTFIATNVQLSDSGHSYTCIASNQYGNTPSTVAVLTVIPGPTNSYPAAVIADHPIAFWRLGEQPDDATGNNGRAAADFMGWHNGVYSNATIAVAGYNALDSDTAATFSGSAASMVGSIGGIDFSASNGVAMAFSVEAWVLSGVGGGGAQANDAGIITKGIGSNEQLNLDTGGSDPAHNFRFFVRDAAGATHGAVATNAPDNNWHHVVGVCDEIGGKVTIYIDGRQNGTTGNVGAVGILGSAEPISIGARKQNATSGYNLAFNGTLDEVAIYNYALTPAQVANHFLATQPPARLVIQPIDAANFSLTWPNINGMVLQSTSDLNLGAGGWQDVPGASNGQATVPVTGATQFYRLIFR